MTPNLESAIALAAMAHSGQKDKNGDPYILHPLRVMLAVPDVLMVQMAAVLHDVCEDNPFFPVERLWIDGYPHEVVNALHCLTKKKDEPYPEFIERCKSNSIARTVKIADLRDNMDWSRMGPQPSEEDFERMTKYENALAVLEA